MDCTLQQHRMRIEGIGCLAGLWWYAGLTKLLVPKHCLSLCCTRARPKTSCRISLKKAPKGWLTCSFGIFSARASLRPEEDARKRALAQLPSPKASRVAFSPGPDSPRRALSARIAATPKCQ